MSALFELKTAAPLLFALVLLAILVISFRSRAVVFCQYLEKMTGISLRPADVSAAYRERGQTGVRELFLDRIIRADLQEGPLPVPDPGAIPADAGGDAETPAEPPAVAAADPNAVHERSDHVVAG
ncbi:MAG TPA: hypothetical protein VFL80_05360 [Thermoanaerobaculia bacterium]|nr:hypothetical protein [Thermoanaerobaculia bacterium]